jgi:hypothetical protein
MYVYKACCLEWLVAHSKSSELSAWSHDGLGLSREPVLGKKVATHVLEYRRIKLQQKEKSAATEARVMSNYSI